MFSQAIVLAASAAGALAQSTTSAASSGDATATVLIGTMTSGFAASVISADACEGTTYALECTAAGVCNSLEGVTITVTEGPTEHAFQYATSTGGASGTYAETCSISESTYAVCSDTLVVGDGQTTISTSTAATLSGSQLNYAQIPITAGGDKLTAAASCTSSGSGAAPTGFTDVYKVLVAPAAAVVMAGAAIL